MSQFPYVERFASADIDYPAHTVAASWQQSLEGFRLTCALPSISDAEIVVPSFTTDDSSVQFRFLLNDAATGWFGPAPSGMTSTPTIDVPVDYFSPRESLTSPTLTIEVDGEAPPSTYIALISVRSRQLTPAIPTALPSIYWDVPTLSQLDAPEAVRMAVCSPTSVAMVTRADEQAIRLSAFHLPSRLYGVWPQNAWATAKAGYPAGIEVASSWENVLPFLERGPVVASIRFQAGALRGSPMPSTRGHMVVVRGIEGDSVLVNDPAAPRDSVLRHYSIDDFTRAWMTHRGVFYFVDHVGWRSPARELG